MHVKFTHGFILDRDLKIYYSHVQEEIDQSQPQKSAIAIGLLLFHNVWTRQWPDRIVKLLEMHDLSPLIYKV